jgi:outer membrane protein assembly factor BamB
VYIGSDDGKIYAVDAASGQELWDITTGDSVTSSPAIANGILYVGSDDGKLYAIK